ncbi:plastid coproporphyrinogen oxidase [Guillardia theta CCMP2712]|uniref:coproporphyrinogen oxidase n=3 Tax=Guillardia theta TaxID=55529 RepID=L1J9C4_GUITC|nr:plastid coproporphyrinogen oxidase [Guillardia theta CCMP2712]EKX45131.1 plastid coproporphyrinogen oxidase [Guillardia theta CCMP2712]|eukprot:XP_005832111.1 plastid coproporphyrinogen oxidase [Guillardia theta CCMP2712]
MLVPCRMSGAAALLPLALLAQAALSSAYVTSPSSLSGIRTNFASSVSKSRRAYPLSWARALRATATKPDQKSEGLGFDSHKAVDKAPDTLCRDGTANTAMRAKFEKMLREAQDYICKSVENVDGGAKFQTDAWTREGGGGGISRVLTGGKVWEKAGCNLSVVYGSMPSEALQAANDRLKFGATDRAKGYAPGERVPFFACGLSSVMHPKNPHCPTMHFNYRYFETEGGVWWFGGGTDITPAYLNVDDMKYFHGTYKEVCDKHDPEFYPKFKKWADEYFFIKHRGETRGLGGIFFDDLNDRDPEKIFEFAKECAMNVPKAYLPIVEAHKNDPFTQKEKEWQLMRRGRYVEFNLVYDRGTIFGLKTGGRIESILMSLPETARWEYDHRPEPGSKEAEVLEVFRNPRDWV